MTPDPSAGMPRARGSELVVSLLCSDTSAERAGSTRSSVIWLWVNSMSTVTCTDRLPGPAIGVGVVLLRISGLGDLLMPVPMEACDKSAQHKTIPARGPRSSVEQVCSWFGEIEMAGSIPSIGFPCTGIRMLITMPHARASRSAYSSFLNSTSRRHFTALKSCLLNC